MKHLENVNTPWINKKEEKVQEEKKAPTNKPRRSNLKTIAINTTVKKGKKTEKEVNPTVRKPTVANLMLTPRDDLLYNIVGFPTHDKQNDD